MNRQNVNLSWKWLIQVENCFCFVRLCHLQQHYHLCKWVFQMNFRLFQSDSTNWNNNFYAYKFKHIRAWHAIDGNVCKCSFVHSTLAVDTHTHFFVLIVWNQLWAEFRSITWDARNYSFPSNSTLEQRQQLSWSVFWSQFKKPLEYFVGIA